ncbi:hypothetical protein [Rosistilla oblonga]|uniref:hypothetical protein n=1 Tax=Rosistilla oblonga TaxID=2527990 RepID=UPI0011A37B02|nr:hypothetical protein [Rosistilla oblonga]
MTTTKNASHSATLILPTLSRLISWQNELWQNELWQNDLWQNDSGQNDSGQNVLRTEGNRSHTNAAAAEFREASRPTLMRSIDPRCRMAVP